MNKKSSKSPKKQRRTMDRRDGSSSSAKKDDDISTGFRSMILTLEEGDVFQVTLCAT